MSDESTMVSQIVNSMEFHPDKWTYGEFHAISRDGNITIWIANGMPFIDVCGCKISVWSKIRVWRACRKLKIRQIMNKIEGLYK